MTTGLIYIAQCAAQPTYLKVGKTTKEYWQREQGLSGSTSLEDWYITRIFNTSDCDKAERLAHLRLARAGRRLHSKKELFEVTKEIAERICGEVVALYPEEATAPAQTQAGYAVSHRSNLWNKLLAMKVSGTTTLASLIVDANYGKPKAINKLRTLGMECTCFDKKAPEFSIAKVEGSILMNWLERARKNFEDLLEAPQQATVQFQFDSV